MMSVYCHPLFHPFMYPQTRSTRATSRSTLPPSPNAIINASDAPPKSQAMLPGYSNVQMIHRGPSKRPETANGCSKISLRLPPLRPAYPSAHANVLEPIPPAILQIQEILAVRQRAGLAALALGRVRAVEVGDVLVADIAEPAEKKTINTSHTRI